MLMDQVLAKNVLDILNTFIEAAMHMYSCTKEKNYTSVEILASEIKSNLSEIYPILDTIKKEIPFISSTTTCENLVYSLNNIIRLVRARSDRGLMKIEFELIPILQEFYYDFYFFTCVFGDKKKETEHYAKEFIKMGVNSYIEESAKTGNFKYDVSIYVLAYNKLEYTKHCVESIIKYTPSNINYELIFINNGSNDETQAYFDSFKCNKEITLLKNNFSDMRATRRIWEGRYILSVSNDVIVTEHYLDNLIACIESDDKIAMVVPTTPNISNIQSIDANYSNLDEMHIFAKNNNVSNSARWEERTRLCNPLALFRSEALASSKGVGVSDKYFVYGEFGDDSLALRLRRAGYKMILAKDCYCYHFGSVTMKEAQVKENTLEKSRKLFLARHGLDAWGTGFCYDPILMAALKPPKLDKVDILGINSGFGSNPLKLKTMHKEALSQNINLFFVTDDERYIQDQQAYGEHVMLKTNGITKAYSDTNNCFDYILIEDNVLSVIKSSEYHKELKGRLSEGGILIIRAREEAEVKMLECLKADEKIKSYDCSWFLWKCKN